MLCSRFARSTFVLGVIATIGLISRSDAAPTPVHGGDVRFEKTAARQADGSWISTATGLDAVGPNGEVFQNSTAFSGQGVTQGPSGQVSGFQTDHLLADDLHLDPAAAPGSPINFFRASIANFNSADASVEPLISFFANDGTNGGPGTLLAAFAFNPITVPAGAGGFFSFAIPAANQFPIPANGVIWAGESFDNGGGATATNAQLENFGQLAFNPPTIGTSADNVFLSTNPSDGFSSNPAGSQGNFGGAPIANFGWELRAAVPEPTTMGVMGLIGLSMLARRRRA